MAEIQDEDQWLYGDDKVEPGAQKKNAETNGSTTETNQKADGKDSSTLTKDPPPASSSDTPETNGEPAPPAEKGTTTEAGAEEKKDEGPSEGGGKEKEGEKNGEKPKEAAAEGGGEDTSDSEDEPTVTIGKIVKQPDIMRPPPPTHRAAPTSGLKEEDFNSVGKINGVAVPDYNVAELEEKPWRKPGADLSDYFNYGFTEDTWIRYCERQKTMRTSESGTGLNALGINAGKNMLGSNIPVSIVNENSKYGGLRKQTGVPMQKGDDDPNAPSQGGNAVNTIQVMTADRRTYSNKVLSGVGGPGSYEDMDFGGSPYGNTDFFSTPPPNFYGPPPPTGPWGSGVPNIPPPGWTPEGGLGPPPPLPHHRGGMGFFEEEPAGGFGRSRTSKEEREMEKIREAIADSRERDRETPRHHTSRRRSRSRSKSRHRRRSRSKSRSPRSPSSTTHKHKRKKSKRERGEREATE